MNRIIKSLSEIRGETFGTIYAAELIEKAKQSKIPQLSLKI